MIEPSTRSTLTDALIPPVGYTFDTGIATTYSLDLGTLMTLPLQLAWLATGEDVQAQSDPIRLLEGLRRVAKRLTVFADRGRIQIPRAPHALMGLMEEMICEVQAPHQGAFHPKCWVLRFIADGSTGEPSLLRMLILSRNLTEDRSWDLNLLLEGRPGRVKSKANREIAEFVIALPGWVSKGKVISAARHALIESLAADMQRCVWELPGEFEEVAFHVLGVGRRPRSFGIGTSDEAVVVSPFVSDEGLQSLVGESSHRVALVSRAEELDLLLQSTLDLFGRVDILSDDADAESEEEVSANSCRGLHAKAIVLRRGWRTHLYVGSANCTNAAILAGKNVEVVAELIGRHTRVGRPEDWVSEKGMGPLLIPYVRGDASPSLKQKLLEERLEQCRQAIVNADLSLECVREEAAYRLCLTGVECLEVGDARIWIWPLTVPSDRQVGLVDAGIEHLDLGLYASQDVTSLTGFRVRLDGAELCFGLELPLSNPPLDREAGVLALILRNRAGFLRYLALLLGEPDDLPFPPNEKGGEGAWFGLAASPDECPPLFEMLVKAFSRSPEKLNYVASAVERLETAQTESGEVLIPPDFLRMWRTFEVAMKLGARR